VQTCVSCAPRHIAYMSYYIQLISRISRGGSGIRTLDRVRDESWFKIKAAVTHSTRDTDLELHTEKTMRSWIFCGRELEFDRLSGM